MRNEADQATIPPGDLERDPVAAAIFLQVAESGALPHEITPAKAVATVLCTLSSRLTAGQAFSFVGSLSQGMRALLEGPVIQRNEEGERFDRQGFLGRVGDELGMSRDDAGALASVVFATIRTGMAPEVVHNVAAQLPADLEELWLSS